jgi:hypothetical protein
MRKHPGIMPFVCVAIAIIASAHTGIARGQGLLQLDKMPTRKAGPPVDYGTSQETFVSIGEWEFAPVASAQTYSDLGLLQGNLLRYSTSAAGGFLAPVRVPDGAVLTSIAFDFCDGSTTGQHWLGALAEANRNDGEFFPVGNQMHSVSDAVNPCVTYTQDISALNLVVDSQTSRFVLLAITQATDASNALAGAVVGYKLRVSPSPGTATFNDVPTSHPFFQYIEALAKSGITGGCGSGNFCPDAPLTRGQMAVFLAKALGLQWP